MADDPPERDVRDFSYKSLLKVRVGDSPTDIPSERTRLLAVSNKYGLTFVGFQYGFKVIRTSELVRLGLEQSKSGDIVEDFTLWTVVKTESPPSHVALSADELTLCVVVKKNDLCFGKMYDTRSFAAQNANPVPFVEVKLTSTSGSNVVDLQWNPGLEFSSMLVTCSSDGSVELLDVKENLGVLGTVPAVLQATCVCWSPKGKQVVVGKKDGKMIQFDQALKAKKEIPAPTVFSEPMSVLDVLWESTHVFVAAYWNGKEGDQPHLVITTCSKTSAPSFAKYEDVCYGGGDRPPLYYLSIIPEWDMILVASATSAESVILGRSSQDKGVWERWNMDDTGRAEVPLTEDYVDTYPTGMALDITSQLQIPMGDSKVHPPSPVFMLLSTDGVLVTFNMIHTGTGVSLNRPLEALSSTGVRVNKNPNVVPVSAAGPPSGPVRSLFQSQGAPPTISTATSQPKTGMTGLFGMGGQTPSLGTKNPGFNLGQGTAEATNFSIGKPLSQSTPAPNTVKPVAQPSAQLAAGIQKPAAVSAASQGGFGFGNQVSSGLNFGGQSAAKPEDAPKPATGLNLVQPSASKASAFGQPLTKHPATEAALNKPQAPGTSGTLIGKTSVSGSSAFTPPSQSTPAKLTSGLSSLLQPSAKTTPAPEIQHKPEYSQPSLPKPTAQTPVVREQQKPTMSAGGANPFTKSIMDEMKHFEKELNDLRSISSNPVTDIGTREEIQMLRKETEEMMEFCKEIKDTTQAINGEINDLNTLTLEAFSTVEECRLREERNKDPSYQNLLRSRALDPISERKMKEVRTQYQYLESGIREVDFKLDSEWEEYQRKKNKGRIMSTPASDTIYRTVATNKKLISGQEHMMDRLCNQLKDIKMYNKTANWTTSTSSRTPTARSNISAHGIENLRSTAMKSASDSILNTSLSPRKAATPVSPEKQAKLRDLLGSRRVTPIKSSAPGNLSLSRIVSPEGLLSMRQHSLDAEGSYIAPQPHPPRNQPKHPPTMRIVEKTPSCPTVSGQIKSSASPEGIKAASPAKGGLSMPKPTGLSPKSLPPASTNMSPVLNMTTKAPSKQLAAPEATKSQTFPMSVAQQTSSSQAPSLSSGGIAIGQSKPFSSGSMFGTPQGLQTTTANKGFMAISKADSGDSPSMKLGGYNFSSQADPNPKGSIITGQNKPTAPAAAPASTPPSMFSGKGFSQMTSAPQTTHPASSSMGFAAMAATKPSIGFGIGGNTLPSTDSSFPRAGIATTTTVTSLTAAKPSVLGTKSTPAPVYEDITPPDTPKQGTVSSSVGGSKSGTPTLDENTTKFAPKVGKEETLSTRAQSSDAIEPSSTGFSFGGAPKSSAGFSFGGAGPAAPTASSQPSTGLFGKSVASTKEEEKLSTPAQASDANEPSNTGFSFGGAPKSSTGFSFGGAGPAAPTASSQPSTGLFGSSVGSNKKASVFGGTSSNTGGSIFGGGSSTGGFSFGDAKAVGEKSADTKSSSEVSSSTGDEGTDKPESEQVPPAVTDSKPPPAYGTPAAVLQPVKSQPSVLSSVGLASTTAVSQPAPTTSVPAPSTSIVSSTTPASVPPSTSAPLAAGSPAGGMFGKLGTSGTPTFGNLTASATATPASVPQSGFAQPSATCGSLFGGQTETSSVGSVFAGSTPTTTSSSVSQPSSTTGSMFGGGSTSIFGATTSSTSAFGGGAANSGGGLFGQSSASGSAFGGGQTSTTATSGGSLFGTQTTTASSGGSVFGGTSIASSGSVFGGTASTPVATSGSAFGGSSGGSAFGGAPTTATSGASMFGGTATTASSAFGQTSAFGASTTSSGVFGGKPAFGQTAAFGQTTSSDTQSTPGFGQTPTTSSGGDGGVFGGGGGGGGGLFGGLGGKPSAENANKNVFGSTSFGSPATTQASGGGLFGGQSSSPGAFGGAKNAAAFAGAFSGGGSVSSTGFGGFGGQQPQSPPQAGQTAGSFGGGSAFGGSPAFGSPPAFGGGGGAGGGFGGGATFGGGTSTFGSGGSSFGSGAMFGSGGTNPGVFGSPAGDNANQPSGFAAFASNDAPSFGTIAQQSPPPFGAAPPPPQQQQQPNTGFGQQGGFGSGGGGSFGSPSQGASFSSYR